MTYLSVQGASGGMIDVISFAITAKIYPNNIALTTSIVETSLNLAVAVTPFLGGVLYEVLLLSTFFMWQYQYITVTMMPTNTKRRAKIGLRAT